MIFTHLRPPPFVELDSKTINGQRWYTTPNGVKYASVTTILGIEKKPWLENWKKALGPFKSAKETKRCADRGTSIHCITEKYLKNQEDPTLNESLSNKKLFNQLKLRLNNINNIRAQEIPLYSHTLHIAGRVDCVADYDNILSIIDFKTSTNDKLEHMIQDYFLQSTAYALMYDELFDEFIEDIVILIAVEKGIMPLVFKRKIDEYVEPLLRRINKFYNTRKM